LPNSTLDKGRLAGKLRGEGACGVLIEIKEANLLPQDGSKDKTPDAPCELLSHKAKAVALQDVCQASSNSNTSKCDGIHVNDVRHVSEASLLSCVSTVSHSIRIDSAKRIKPCAAPPTGEVAVSLALVDSLVVSVGPPIRALIAEEEGRDHVGQEERQQREDGPIHARPKHAKHAVEPLRLVEARSSPDPAPLALPPPLFRLSILRRTLEILLVIERH